MIAAGLGRAAVVGALPASVLAFDLSVILVAVFAVSVFGEVFSPRASAIPPSLLGADDLPRGNGLLEAGTTLAGFVGSPVGGALILRVGVRVGLLYSSEPFAFSALAVGGMAVPVALHRTTGAATTRTPSLLLDVAVRFRTLPAQPAALPLTHAGKALNFSSVYLLCCVANVSNLLYACAEVCGLLVGLQSTGYAVGALPVVGRVRTDRAPGVRIPRAWGLEGPPPIVLIVSPALRVATASMVSTGVVLSAFVTRTFTSAVQTQVPNESPGRYFATDRAGSYAVVPAGLPIGGGPIVALGVGSAFVIAGVATLVRGVALLPSRPVGPGRACGPERVLRADGASRGDGRSLWFTSETREVTLKGRSRRSGGT